MNPLLSEFPCSRARTVLAVAATFLCLVATTASAEEASQVEVPATQNPYIHAIASLYEQSKYEEALSRVEKALESSPNETHDKVWLNLMKGVLQVETASGVALESFKEALKLDPNAQLPVKPSRRLRKLFEQARSTAALPTEQQIREAEAPVAAPSGPPPRRYGLSTALHGEVDALGLSVTKAIAPAVSVAYTQEKQGAVATVLVQPSPGLRVEGQYHPILLRWVRPYVGLGATTFFYEKDAQDVSHPFGGVGARGSLGFDVQWNNRMYAFADVAYEHFFITGGERYRSQSVLFSLGVGVFP